VAVADPVLLVAVADPVLLVAEEMMGPPVVAEDPLLLPARNLVLMMVLYRYNNIIRINCKKYY
jgi:hypothetical protein